MPAPYPGLEGALRVVDAINAMRVENGFHLAGAGTVDAVDQYPAAGPGLLQGRRKKPRLQTRSAIATTRVDATESQPHYGCAVATGTPAIKKGKPVWLPPVAAHGTLPGLRVGLT